MGCETGSESIRLARAAMGGLRAMAIGLPLRKSCGRWVFAGPLQPPERAWVANETLAELVSHGIIAIRSDGGDEIATVTTTRYDYLHELTEAGFARALACLSPSGSIISET